MDYEDDQDSLIISYENDLFVVQPNSKDTNLGPVGENNYTRAMKSVLSPLSQSKDIYTATINRYAGNTEDKLLVTPESVAEYLEEGSMAKLNDNIPCRIKYRGGSKRVMLDFDEDLADSNEPQVVLRSFEEDWELAELVDETVRLDLEEPIVENIRIH